MPAFTAIGAAVVSYLGGAAVLGTFGAIAVSAIVATGAAYITSRVINGNPNKGSNGVGNQGGRIQVPPATNNKIPVVYGNAYVNGVITDARLVNENKTMYYCIVLSETSSNQIVNSVYTVNDIYYNDLRLVAVDSGANAHKIKEGRKTVDGPGEDFIDTNFVVDGNSLVELRVYAGSTAATDQIYPPQSSGNLAQAYNFWGGNDGSWDSTYEMKGLVFAIVKITYNGEKGFTALPNMTFRLNNSKNNPADVWFDYMTSSRYGADISPAYIDQTAVTGALAKWRSYCDELITYTPVGGGTATQKRYTVNGVIDTNRAVKENIDIILQNGGAWLSYNVNTGLWQPVTKRAATVPELGSALQFTDDNIITGISISSTRLEDLYNSFEAEFYDKNNKDQKAYARLKLPDAERNPNEPDNQLRLSLELVNNSVQAELLAQIELRQSRDDLVIEFTADSYGIQAQAGDVIAVTSDLYDWSPKYFRVMRVKEIETDEGGLVANIQALEYNADVYTVEDITEFTTSANIGIGVYGASPNLPEPPRTVITELDTDVAVPFFQMQVEIPAAGGPFDEIELFISEGWDPIDITGSIVPGTGANGAAVGQGLMTVTAFSPSTPFGVINSGDYFDLGGVTVLSQITNTPSSKTFVSGGAVATNTVTLNNVTGLLVGNNLTGTGLSTAGSHILAIGPGNQVTVDEFFTAQASGTYTVTGGLGTYIVNTSTTTSGTDTLYDLPVDADFKYLRKVVPAGNNPTFTNGETISITITDLPANSATYRRWFIKARMGVKKFYGRFSQPGIVNKDGNFRYTPSPVGGGGLNDLSDVDITTPNEGQILYYDATTSKWINTSILEVDDTATRGGIIVGQGITQPMISFPRQADTANAMYGMRGISAFDDPWFVGAGSIGNDQGYLEIATGDNTGDPEGSGSPIYVRQYDGYSGSANVPWYGGTGTVVNQLTLLDENGNTVVPKTLAVNGGNITTTATGTLSIFNNASFNTLNIGDGVTNEINIGGGNGSSQVTIRPPTLVGEATTQAVFDTVATTVNAFRAANTITMGAVAGTTALRGNATVNDNLTVSGSTFLGNNYITDDTHVIGEFKVTNNGVANLFVDRNTGRIGINDTTPSFNLDINGNFRTTGSAQFDSTVSVAGNLTASSDLAVNGGDITSTYTAGSFNLLNQPAAVNAFTASAATRIGALTGTTTIGYNLNLLGPTLTLNSDDTVFDFAPNIVFEDDGVNPAVITWNTGALPDGSDEYFSFSKPIQTATNKNITSNGNFILDRSGGGTYTSTNAGLYVKRAGVELPAEVSIIWNESVNRWVFAGAASIADLSTTTIKSSNTLGTVFTLSGNDVTTGGNITVTGDVIVQGDTLTINSNSADASPRIVFGSLDPDTSISYNQTSNRFDFASPITTLNQQGLRVSQDLFGAGLHGAVVAGTTGTISTGGDFVFQRNGGTYPTNDATIRVDRAAGATDATITWTESTATWNLTNNAAVADVFSVGNDLIVTDDASVGGDLTVTGNITTDGTVFNRSFMLHKTIQVNASAADSVIDSWNANTYRTAKYNIQVALRANTVGPVYHYKTIEIMLIAKHDNTSVEMIAYGEIDTVGYNLSTFSATISGSTVSLRATPFGSTFTIYRMDAVYMESI